MSYCPRRLRPRPRPKGIPFILRFTVSKGLTMEQYSAIRSEIEDASRRGSPLMVSRDVEVIVLDGTHR